MKQEAIRPVPVGTDSTIVAPAKPAMPKMDPNTRVIAKGEYATFEVELDQRAEVMCEVTADAAVNVYLMDADNLNSLDLGEEFWSETGEEGRSEEHTSELQSHSDLVCRLLLEKKKNT